MLSSLVVRRHGHDSGGAPVVSLRAAPNGEVPMTPFEARRLAAQLTAAADALEPPPDWSRSGRPSLGWRWFTGFVVDLDEAETLDALVANWVNGLTDRENAERLNAHGRTTKMGRPWTPTYVERHRRQLVRRGGLDRADAGRNAARLAGQQALDVPA